MSPLLPTKRIILKILLAADPMPMPEPALEDGCRVLQPALLTSDFKQAIRELDGTFLSPTRDPLDTSLVAWGLNATGRARASQP